MEIILYKYTDRPNRVNKTLGNGETVQGVIRNEFNYLNPTITVRASEIKKVNYCFVPYFGRYYFVTGITQRNRNEYEISLSVDVLTTYKSVILEASGTVTETANGNKYSSARSVIYDKKPKLEKVVFPEQPLDNEGKIIMVTLKGNI